MMTGLYAGNFKVQQWIEQLISTTLVGEDHFSSDVRDNVTTMTPSSLVQVVSIGRPKLSKPSPLSMRRSTMPLSNGIPNITAAKNTDTVVDDTPTGVFLRSTSFNNVQQLLKSAEDGNATLPTSLLVSDGSTTILAVLSKQTRSSLSALATDNSLNNYQNNTITRGCVLKISDWRLDTLASAIRAEEANDVQVVTSGNSSALNEDDEASSRDTESHEKNATSLSNMEYRNDPLLRDHQSLCHHRYFNRQSQYHLPPDKVVVLYILGPIEIMGGHGLSVVGRPKYIMEAIDVLRTIDEATGSQIKAKIRETTSSAIVCMKKNLELEHTMKQYQSDGATIVTPALHRRTVSSGLDKPDNVARGVSSDIIPLGDVVQLFDSPKRRKLNAIWETFAAVAPSHATTTETAYNKSLEGTNQNLFVMGGAISNDSNDDSSSGTDFAIGTIDASADHMELKRLFRNIIGNSKREDKTGNSISEEGEVVDQLITQVEEVMSDEYSHSDVSCDDDDDDSRLGIRNMLLSQESTADQQMHPVEIAIAVANESLSNEMEAQKPSVRQQKHLRIKPVVVKQNPQMPEDVCESDVEDSCIPPLDEDLLDTQPIHPVSLPEQGNVIDDDVSIDGDEVNLLSDVEQVNHRIDIDTKANDDDDVREFHDAVWNEDDLPNDEDGSYTPVETLHDIEGRLDRNDSDLSLDVNLLQTQPEILAGNYNEVSPIDCIESLWPKAFGRSDVEMTYDRWMRIVVDTSNNQVESTGPEHCLNGDSIRKFLC